MPATESREAIADLADEQAALRRVAVLVARGTAPAEIFLAVSAEVDRVFGLDRATFDVAVVGRFDPGPEIVVVGISKTVEGVPLGSRWRPDDLFSPSHVLRTGRSARIHADDVVGARGEVAEFLRHHGYQSQVASPIVVDGRLWGAMVVATRNDLPPDAEERLERFTELVATAIANAESHEALAELAEEQAALRRVATLVAEGAPPDALFRAVVDEVASVVGLPTVTLSHHHLDGSFTVVATKNSPGFPVGSRWPLDGPSLAATIHETGRAARIDDYSNLGGAVATTMHDSSLRAAAGSPIVVDGQVWGHISVAAMGAEPLPVGTEQRLLDFTELIATAIANADSRDALARLADEQAALRRVATLVARDAPHGEVFDAVAMEVGTLLETDITVVGRYDADGTATAIGSWSASPGGVPVGYRSVLGGHNVLTLVAETGRPARVDSYEDASGEAAEIARHHGWRSSIGAPIFVNDGLWGVMLVATQHPETFPAGAEERLAAFTDLVATALANAQAHDEVRRFGEEQAALGRVATLVAAGAAPQQVFTAVVDEVSSLVGAERIEFVRYDGDNTGTVIAASGEHPFPTGSTWSLEDPSVIAEVARTRRAARIDDYSALKGEIARTARSAGFRSAIGAPLTVEGRLWGVIIAISTDLEPIPESSEARLNQFTELVATAVANAEARQALERVATEQAALRRVATLVAQGSSPQELFDAVAEEVGRLLPAADVSMARFEPDDSVTSMASWSSAGPAFPTGRRWPIKGTNVSWMVLQTGRPARIDDYSAATDPIGIAVREAGYTSAVGSPIVVEGRLWGVISAASTEGPMPPDTEARLERFTDLVATAIANAEGSAELAASRRRIVAASDDARRRIERDLHDGVQQQLFSVALELGMMKADPPTGDALKEQLASVTEDVGSVLDALVETARGIHPAILSQGGLAAALGALARRSAVPVTLHAQIQGPLPDEVEVAAYYVAAETLTNTAKHAHASAVQLDAATAEGSLRLTIRDDGVGGAYPGKGSGLVGLHDRVEALGGTIMVDSSAGSGTCVTVTLPIATEPDQELETVLGATHPLGGPTSPG